MKHKQFIQSKHKYNTCGYCGKEYELGFYGTGTKYCSRECYNKTYKRKTYGDIDG